MMCPQVPHIRAAQWGMRAECGGSEVQPGRAVEWAIVGPANPQPHTSILRNGVVSMVGGPAFASLLRRSHQKVGGHSYEQHHRP